MRCICRSLIEAIICLKAATNRFKHLLCNIFSGKSEEDAIKLFKTYKYVNSIRRHKDACAMKHLNKTQKQSFHSNRFVKNRTKLKHLSTKLFTHKKQNLILKSKFDKKSFYELNKALNDTSNQSKVDRVFRNKHTLGHISKNLLPRRDKDLKYKKWKRKMMYHKKQNSVLKS